MSDARAAVEAELLAWMRDEPESEDEARFARLALETFRYQAERCPPFGRFCAGRGIRPASVDDWRDIPAAPTAAFKELDLRSFEGPARTTFRTSGTGRGTRGALPLDTLALYEASLVPSFLRGVLPELRADAAARMPLFILAPSAEEAPDSSLSHMFDVILRERGAPGSGFFVRGGALDSDALLDALGRQTGPVAICGTAFAFVHLFDALEERGRQLSLPSGTRVMETGGFKGRATERPPEVLYAQIAAGLGVAAECIVNQYGMTELGSQFYDSVLAEPGGPRRKLAPPWTRVRVLDPLTGAERAEGETGLLQIVDLANTGSVAFLRTEDLGRRVPGGFEVIGRAAGAEARGCSIALDEMLGAR